VFAANTTFGLNTTYNANALVTRCIFSGNGTTGHQINQAVPTVEHCLFGANGGGLYMFNRSHATVRYCVVAGNVITTDNGGGILVNSGTDCLPTLLNCTVAGNRSSLRGGGLAAIDAFSSSTVLNQANPILRNCLFWDNSAALGGNEIYANNLYGGCSTISYTDLAGGVPGTSISGTVSSLGGNINTNPLFAPAVSGTWTATGTFDAVTGQTILTNSGAAWTSGQFASLFLNPSTNQFKQFVIATNSATTITVWGDAAALASNGIAYLVRDYHLQSAVGRWTQAGWVMDETNSPCLNAGSPLDSYANEPAPNGNQIDMGAYGGTVEASKLGDMTPPEPPSGFLALSGNAQIFLTWVNSRSTDSAGVLLLRRDGAAPTGAPVPGTSYLAGDTIGDALVVLAKTGEAVSAARSWTNTALANGTHYYYTLHAFDGVTNYSAAVASDTTPAAGAGLSPILVDAAATGGNNGTSWADAYVSLKQALVAATNGIQVWVARGSYKPGAPFTETFAVKAGVGLYGGFTNGMSLLEQRDWAANPTLLDANIGDLAVRADNSDHLLTVGNNGILDGFVVTNGYTIDGGLFLTSGVAQVRNCLFVDNEGGAYFQSCSPVISNCVFRGNINGVYCYGGSPQFRKILFFANTAYGLRSETSSSPGVEDSVFAANTIGAYGYASGTPTFTRCLFSGNTAGGLTFNSASARIDASVFCGNSKSTYGAAIGGLNQSSPLIRNSLFLGNRSTSGTGDGGALGFDSRCAPVISNCTIAANAAASRGGGLYVASLNDANVVSVKIINSIFWGNAATNGGNEIFQSGSGCQNKSVAISWSDVAGGVPGTSVSNAATDPTVVITNVGGVIAANPRFAPTQTGIWSAAGVYDVTRGQTVLTDATAVWPAGVLAGAFVNPVAATQTLRFAIASNSATTLAVWGNAAMGATGGVAYAIEDCHVQSSRGRYAAGGWVSDPQDSPCIDSGDTNSVWALEPEPNGKRINMGAYGNTAEASLSRGKRPGAVLILR
jgi:hypothetical protein